MRFDNLTRETARWHAEQATLTTGVKHVAVPTPDRAQRGLLADGDFWMVIREDLTLAFIQGGTQ